jgi:ketosteroid isomerase-like protein
MNMTSSLQTVRHFYDALGRGDVPAVLGLLDPHIEWTEAERFPYYAGTWHGPDAIVKGLFEPLGRDWSRFEVNPGSFVTEGSETVCFGNYVGTHRRTGRSVTAAFAHHWTVRDGKITRFVQHTDTAKVLEAVRD